MIRTYSKNIEVTSGTAIPLNINKLFTGNGITHTAGSSEIALHNPGFYNLNCDISFTSAATTPVNIQLFANDVAIPDAIISANVTDGQYVNCSFNTIIRAAVGLPSQSVVLTIIPTADITISNIAVGVDQ